MSVIQSHQLDTGINPGQVPMFAPNGTLPLGADPIANLDAVTLQYLTRIISNNTNIPTKVELSGIQQSIQQLQEQLNTPNIDIQQKLIDIEKQISILNTPPYIPTDLIEYKKYTQNKIKQLVSSARSEYMTDALGQSEVYREKVDQAIDYLLQRSTIDIALYPLVRIDAEVFNISHYEAAENIIKQKKIWMQKTCYIEKLRLIIKKEVDLATSIDYINSLIKQFIEDLNLQWQT